ncbi:hypothetical protein [uncultured Enterovirga sp.]|uniref:hypothetical protein n=1 Tax=uncultured Enterovirga sp. TaxID=2026352 RepID=UPI0035CC659F
MDDHNVQNATFEILKGIQTSIAELRTDMDRQFGEVGHRFGKLEDGLRTEWRNNAGVLVMMRATVGHFEERVRTLDDRVDDMQRRLG